MTYPDDVLKAPALPRLGLSVATISAIALGGAIGTLARFLLDTAFAHSSGQFPTTTLVINLTGSLAIGFLVPLTERLRSRHPVLRPFLIIGVLGGWTTYSTLAVDAVSLARVGHAATGAASLVATLVGGILLVVLGNAAGRRLAAA